MTKNFPMGTIYLKCKHLRTFLVTDLTQTSVNILTRAIALILSLIIRFCLSRGVKWQVLAGSRPVGAQHKCISAPARAGPNALLMNNKSTLITNCQTNQLSPHSLSLKEGARWSQLCGITLCLASTFFSLPFSPPLQQSKSPLPPDQWVSSHSRASVDNHWFEISDTHLIMRTCILIITYWTFVLNEKRTYLNFIM